MRPHIPNRPRPTAVLSALVLSAASAAGLAQEMLPMAAGNRWTYRAENGITTVTRIDRVVAMGGVQWFRFVHESPDGQSEEVLRSTPEGIFVMQRGSDGLPSVDARLKAPFDRPHVWTVEADGCEVDVEQTPGLRVRTPAGEFRCVRMLATTETEDGEVVAANCYAPGVGIVRSEIRTPRGSIRFELVRFESAAPAQTAAPLLPADPIAGEAPAPVPGATPPANGGLAGSSFGLPLEAAYLPLIPGRRWEFRDAKGRTLIMEVGRVRELNGIRCTELVSTSPKGPQIDLLAWTPKGLLILGVVDAEGNARALPEPVTWISLPLTDGATWEQESPIYGKVRFGTETSVSLTVAGMPVLCLKATMAGEAEAKNVGRDLYLAPGFGPVRIVYHFGGDSLIWEFVPPTAAPTAPAR